MIMQKGDIRTETIVEIPGVATERYCRDSAAGRGNWASTTKSSEPDHNLVLVCSGAAAARQESIESDISIY